MPGDNRDSSFYVCEIEDSGIVKHHYWFFWNPEIIDPIDTTYDSIVFKREMDTVYRSPFYWSVCSGNTNLVSLRNLSIYIDSISVNKCIYKGDTLFVGIDNSIPYGGKYLEKYGVVHCWRPLATTNTTSGRVYTDLISHNGVLFDTAEIIPLIVNTRNMSKGALIKKKPNIYFGPNYLIINDAENDSKINRNGYALYSINGRILQKGIYTNNTRIPLHNIQIPHAIIVKLATDACLLTIKKQQ
ncbi:MAG: hypothetical protein JW768_06030 [Chitinispirillaceae bacterium]|nr:hypothetical protein [Chitinispirillaceae bacterium]